MSATVFGWAIDDALSPLQDKWRAEGCNLWGRKGIHAQGRKKEPLHYMSWADDLKLCATGAGALQSQISECEVALRPMGLALDPTKTAGALNEAAAGRTAKDWKLQVRGRACGRQENGILVWLGNTITVHGASSLCDVHAACGKAWAKFHELSAAWASGATEAQRLRLLGATVGAVLLANCQTWRLDEAELNLICQFQRKASIICISRRSERAELDRDPTTCPAVWHRQNERARDLRKSEGLPDWSPTAEKRRWHWMGHAARLPDAHLVHDILRWDPKGDKRVVRLDDALREKVGSKWWNSALDRDAWRNW